MRRLIPTAQFLAALASALLLTGCAETKAPDQPAVDLQGYRRVYLAPTKKDYYNLRPMVQQRLEKCGFDVLALTSIEPPVGGQGSGFILNAQGDILTCAHVVGNRLAATVWIQGNRYVGRVAAVDTNLDAAVITLGETQETFRPVPFAAQNEYRMGQDVYTMGFPLAELLGKSPRLTKGLVSATVGMRDNPLHLQVSAEVQPGNSGGPLLNGNGEVVGMVASTLEKPSAGLAKAGGPLPQNVNFAIKSGPILRFLATNKFSPVLAVNAASSNGLDDTKNSIALVRGGLVQESDLTHAPLFCRFSYQYSTGREAMVREISVEFLDAKTGKHLLTITGHGDKEARSMDALLDRTFAEIAARFFPNPAK